MNGDLNALTPKLLPFSEAPLSLSFHNPAGFGLPLISFPIEDQTGVCLTAFAESRPTIPEFIGAGWHLPLERIVADRRRGCSKATLFLEGSEIELRQSGWSKEGDILYETTESFTVSFQPQLDQWRVTNPGNLTRVYLASPKSAPKSWYLAEVQHLGKTWLRCHHHHGKVTQLLEIRDPHGHCVRFEHSPLRGNSSQLLLRAISLEGPKRSTLARLQLSYALHQVQRRQEPILKSMLIRESGETSRNARFSFDYFSPTRSRSRLLKSVSSGSRAAHLFVPELPPTAPVRHESPSLAAERLEAVRFWHREDITLIAEQWREDEIRQTRLSIYARPEGPPLYQETFPHSHADLERASCLVHRNQILILAPNLLKQDLFEVFLFQRESTQDDWVPFRRSLPASRIGFLEPGEEGVGLQVFLNEDPHTSYQYHWFDLPREWTLTSITPACDAPREAEGLISLSGGEPDQESLFGRHSLPSATPSGNAAVIREEHQIDWQKDELFAASPEGPEEVALTS